LAKNDGSGNWGSGAYGFWAKDGNQLQFDGDATYEAGEWNVQGTGAFKVLDNSDNTVIRLGYYDPGAGTDYGLWFFDSTGGELGYVTGTGFQVGDAGNDEYISYTPATGLVVKGTVTATELITTNFSGTSAGVTIDENGLTSNEGIIVGDTGSAGEIVFKSGGGTIVGEIYVAGAGTTSAFVIEGGDANEWVTIRSGPTSTVESDITLLGTGMSVNPAAQVLINPVLHVGGGISATSYSGKLHIAGDVRWDGTTSASATAGSNGDVPAQVVGYLQVNISGTNYKIPYYDT